MNVTKAFAARHLTGTVEAIIGAKMLAHERDNGHRRAMPRVLADTFDVIRARRERVANMYFAKLSANRIARETGIPLETVKQDIRTIRAKITGVTA